MNNNKELHINLRSEKLIDKVIGTLSISSRLEYFISVLLKEFNLTLPQFNALRVLAIHNPDCISLKILTENMIDKSSNTSRLVDKLEEKKLVIREHASNDLRTLHISITELGLNLNNRASEVLEAELEKYLSDKDNEGM
jgi:DNA-binding MarR family transcriptional regulator